MHSISIPQFKSVLMHGAVRMREPIMGWGMPGVGKSQAVHQVAEELDAHLIDIRLSQYDSVDLRGIPTAENGVTVWNVPGTLPFKTNPKFAKMAKKLIILFLDEINSAVPATSAVAYQLVNDRKVGEHELMDNVIIIAAGNREGDKGVVNKMPTPLANRFTHVEIILNVDAWCEHARNIGLSPIGIGFMQFRKPLLSTFIVEKDGHSSVTLDKAFATPRTWEKALRYFADTTMPESDKQVLMAGAVGTGPSEEFWGFVKVYSQIQTYIPAILKSPASADVPSERSFMYALSVALSGMMTTKNVPSIHRYLKRLDAEFVVLAWLLATKRDEELFSTDEFMDYSKHYKTVFA